MTADQIPDGEDQALDTPGADPATSRSSLLPALAEIEAGLQQGEATRGQIRTVAGRMRDEIQAQLDQVEARGVRTPEEQMAYQALLADRRRCTLIAAGQPGTQ